MWREEGIMNRQLSLLACAASLATASAIGGTARAADEFSIALKPGDGVEVVSSQCAACHSLDYIQMNSPFPSAKLWETEVMKMINTFGATIEPDEAKTIIDYLAKNYGS
jgi:hypothetical protein